MCTSMLTQLHTRTETRLQEEGSFSHRKPCSEPGQICTMCSLVTVPHGCCHLLGLLIHNRKSQRRESKLMLRLEQVDESWRRPVEDRGSLVLYFNSEHGTAVWSSSI